ncbi:MAG TPA: DHA2 family efflux MFS transporter permease subunit [Actinophytocola sp.]|uniref:DHA2 family efflux MFS transporter permease subunit n=1 Tax=Actinophytocola sp. TaxID=1872138 RepID=UPI002DDDAC3C|nr:DHA2 family efflux MFS transporter permease subunit [Actinophytocola sp.]HEV2784089.1 DHA2 family efflux MFS transporter permease subunit [Actinophytocola sp.]
MAHTVPTTSSTSSTRDTRWLALYVLCTGMLMIVLDMTIVNVALPAIQSDLGFTQTGLAWVVNAYLIAFGGLLLLAGRLGDLVGRKRVFLIGLGVFTVASVLCGASTSAAMLIISRFVQGVGGAMATAVTLGMIVTMFPEQREQTKAIGVFSFVAAAGASVGLLLGGVLTQSLNWHWIFFVNIPIGIAAALLTARLVPSDRGIGFGRGADVLGAFLVTASLMLLVYTIVKTEEHGWGSAHTLGLGALAIVLLIGFIVRQFRAANPLLPMRIFKSRNVAGGNLIQIMMVAGMFGMFFLGTLYMQKVLGYDALEIGLAFLPTAVAIGGLSVGLSARLITRFGARPVLVTGLSLALVGLLLFTRTPVDGEFLADVLAPVLLVGLGMGLAFPSLMTLAMSGATQSDAGLASGLVNTTAQVGGALGLAVLATLATGRTTALLAEGNPVPAALTGGFHLAFWIGAGLLAVGITLGVFLLQSKPAMHAEEEPAAEEPVLDAA